MTDHEREVERLEMRIEAMEGEAEKLRAHIEELQAEIAEHEKAKKSARDDIERAIGEARDALRTLR